MFIGFVLVVVSLRIINCICIFFEMGLYNVYVFILYIYELYKVKSWERRKYIVMFYILWYSEFLLYILNVGVSKYRDIRINRFLEESVINLLC